MNPLDIVRAIVPLPEGTKLTVDHVEVGEDGTMNVQVGAMLPHSVEEVEVTFTLDQGQSVFAHRSEILGSHDLREDPTHDLSRVYRETCERCGRAALQMPGGKVYGSASEVACDRVEP